ncbi:HNH endonuclease [Paucilactobacillus sp. N302-9]
MRRQALKLHGYKCLVCGFDFKKVYGEIGSNFIEVHHVKPISKYSAEHTVNPETDLVPVCANCHRMIHRRKNDILSISELKNLIKQQE